MPTTRNILRDLAVILTENIGVWLHPGLRRGGLSTGHFSANLQNPTEPPEPTKGSKMVNGSKNEP